MDIKREKIKKITKLGSFNNEYVYDISIKDKDPYFFANDCLVHNTDSSYFTAENVIKNDPKLNKINWTKEKIIQLYDSIADEVNNSFPSFMGKAFNIPEENGKIIQAGRELVASKGLFIKKKRYSVLIYDLEGWRLDLLDEESAKKKGVVHEHGKIKSMGLDTKRTDTPKPIQDFLTEVLTRVLKGEKEQDILNYISEFREEFKKWPPYLKGRPTSANKLGYYTNFYNNPNKRINGRKPTVPGHIRAAIHWNKLREAHGDFYSLEIQDGYKIIVCQLKSNPMRWDSIAYPVDEMHLPNWFTDLEFDSANMESSIIDQKLQNIIGILKWDLMSTKSNTTFNSLFVKK